jgi:hypothetical protein
LQDLKEQEGQRHQDIADLSTDYLETIRTLGYRGNMDKVSRSHDVYKRFTWLLIDELHKVRKYEHQHWRQAAKHQPLICNPVFFGIVDLQNGFNISSCVCSVETGAAICEAVIHVDSMHEVWKTFRNRRQYR